MMGGSGSRPVFRQRSPSIMLRSLKYPVSVPDTLQWTALNEVTESARHRRRVKILMRPDRRIEGARPDVRGIERSLESPWAGTKTEAGCPCPGDFAPRG